MPDAAVPVVRGRAHLITLPILPEADVREPERGPARGQAALLCHHCQPRVVQPEECTLWLIQDDVIKYREGLESNIHEQLSECKQEIYIRIEQIFQKYELKLIKEVQEKYRECSVY